MNTNIEEDIDIKLIYRIILRNKILLFTFIFIGILMGATKYVLGTKVWLGEFQIVLSKKEASRITNSKLANFVGIDPSIGTSSIKTEVEILKSPYVLTNVFEFVKSKKKIKDDEILFKNWKDSLNINLVRGTSVLNLSYKDSNKELILPVLKKISETYQDYSGKARLRSIQLGLDYFSEQIDKYRKLSIQSIRDAQEFAIQQDLSIIEENKDIDKEIINRLNIEAIRVSNANKIRSINEQLNQLDNIGDVDDYTLLYIAQSIESLQEEGLPEKISELDNKLIDLKNTQKYLEEVGNDPIEIQYFGKNIEQIQSSGLPKELKNIEEQIIYNRYIFTDNDPSIKMLFEKRRKLIEVYKKQAIAYVKADIKTLTNSRPQILESIKERTRSFLLAEKLAAKAVLKATERPKGVLIKYKFLKQKAEKESRILNNLEDQYRELTLERAKYQDPWELITNPTLINEPIAPKKKDNLFKGFLVGLISGLATIFILEKKKNIIYSSDDIQNLTNKFSIKKVFDLSISNLDDTFYILSQSLKDQSKAKLVFFYIDKIYSDQEKTIEKYIKKFNPNTDIKITNKIEEIDSNAELFIIANLGKSKFNQFIKINEKISALNKKAFGLILFDKFQDNDNQT